MRQGFLSRSSLILALVTGLSACGDRQGATDAATALAEAIYPGQLELLDTHLRKGYYDVTFAVKGDAFSRVRFSIDSDPAQCRPETRCEERLRQAHDEGIAAGAKLKALNAALPACGATILGVHDDEITPAFRTVVELDLDVVDQQPGLDRLTPCIAAFRAALPGDATAAQKRLNLRIIRPEEAGNARPETPASFEMRLDGKRAATPTYMISLAPDQPSLSARNLRLYGNFLSNSGLDERLAEAARATLATGENRGHVPNVPLIWGLRLDGSRLDVIRAYVLACSVHEPGKGPCKEDQAVRLRLDLASGAVSEQMILHDIYDDKRRLRLPDLPGR